MPTASKLVAGVMFAIFGYMLSQVLLYRVPTLGSTEVGPRFFAIVAFCFGWSKVGVAAELSYTRAWASGLGSAIAAALTMVLLGAAHHVYRGMGYHAYKDVDGMLTAFMRKALEFAGHIFDPYIFVAIIAAGFIASTFAGFAGRLWR